MFSEPTDMGESGSGRVAYQKAEKDGEVLFEGVLHEDYYESPPHNKPTVRARSRRGG